MEILKFLQADLKEETMSHICCHTIKQISLPKTC